MPPKRAASVVWKYYSRIPENKDSAQCAFCMSRIVHCGNTTSLWKHLKLKHHTKIKEPGQSSENAADNIIITNNEDPNVGPAKARPSKGNPANDGPENDGPANIDETRTY